MLSVQLLLVVLVLLIIYLLNTATVSYRTAISYRILSYRYIAPYRLSCSAKLATLMRHDFQHNMVNHQKAKPAKFLLSTFQVTVDQLTNH